MSNVALSWWSLFSPSRLVKWITWTRFKPGFVCSKADKHNFFLKLWDLNSNFTLTLGYLEPALNNPPWCNKIILHFWDSASICKANRSTSADEALVKLKMVVYFDIRELISCLCQNLLNQQLVTKDTFVLHWAPGLDNCITFVVNMNGLGGSATMIIFYRSNMKGGGGGFGGFLPGVIGCVDSTHIKIQAPHENENGFFNRKGFHSMNVQAICNHKAR